MLSADPSRVMEPQRESNAGVWLIDCSLVRLNGVKKMVKEFRDEPDSDGKGAVENQVRRIRTIRGREVLGYEGGPHEEHTGQEEGERAPGLSGELADNDPSRDDC